MCCGPLRVTIPPQYFDPSPVVQAPTFVESFFETLNRVLVCYRRYIACDDAKRDIHEYISVFLGRAFLRRPRGQDELTMNEGLMWRAA